MPSVEQVSSFFRWFADEPGVPLYNRLSAAVADEPWLCELVTRARSGQARPVLLFAAVHRLVLDHPDEELAAWYPTVTGRDVPAADPVPAFLAFCRRYEAAAELRFEYAARLRDEINELRRELRDAG